MKTIFVNKFSIITLLIVATATISLIAVSVSSANAQDLPEPQTPPIETPPSSSEKTDEVNTDSDSGDVEPFYKPAEILIRYKDPAPVLENEDETGIIYLRGRIAYEATFVSRGLAVVSEDFASVGVDTAGLEIFGGVESSNIYFVRYNADIDPPQLSSQLGAIDRIDWVQPNYLSRWEPDYVIREESLDQIENLELETLGSGRLEPYEDHRTAVTNIRDSRVVRRACFYRY